MGRRISAYALILLANIVILAHAVIPHHHHHEQVCMDNTCCKEDADHNHNAPEQNHQHDGDKNTATCVLKQAIALPANQGRQEFDSVYSSDNHSHDFLFTLYNDGAETEVPAFLFLASNPEITFSYSTYLIGSLGLRAPPTV